MCDCGADGARRPPMAAIVEACGNLGVGTPTQYVARWTEVAVVARERGSSLRNRWCRSTTVNAQHQSRTRWWRSPTRRIVVTLWAVFAVWIAHTVVVGVDKRRNPRRS